MKPVPLLASILAVTLLAACNDGPSAPRVLSGEYAVVQANGSALPTMILTYPTNDGIRLLDGTVDLRMPDTLVLTMLTQYVSASGTTSAPVTDSARARFTLSGTALELRQLGAEPFAFESAGSITSDGTIQLTTVRPLPASQGTGTYSVVLRARK